MSNLTALEAAELDARVINALWLENTGRDADRMRAIRDRCEAAGYDVDGNGGTAERRSA